MSPRSGFATTKAKIKHGYAIREHHFTNTNRPKMNNQSNASMGSYVNNQYVALKRKSKNKKEGAVTDQKNGSSLSTTQRTDEVCESLLENLRQLPDENRPNDWLVPTLIH